MVRQEQSSRSKRTSHIHQPKARTTSRHHSTNSTSAPLASEYSPSTRPHQHKRMQFQPLATSKSTPTFTPPTDVSSLRGNPMPGAEFASAAMSLTSSISNILYSKSKSSSQINKPTTVPYTRSHSINVLDENRKDIIRSCSHEQEMSNCESPMDHHAFVRRDQWISHSERKSCGVCARDFSVLLRNKHSCRMCGDVVCGGCSVFKLVNLPIGDSKVRVCSRCIITYRERVQSNVQQVQNIAEKSNGRRNSTPTDAHHEPRNHRVKRSQTVSHSIDDDKEEKPVVGPKTDRVTPQRSMLLSPELSASMSSSKTFRNSRTLSTFTSPVPVVLLSSSDTEELRLANRTCTESWSQHKSQREGLSYSFASTVSFSSSASSIRGTMKDEEIGATLHTKDLKREVQRSRERIEELEKRIEDQETRKITLSDRQQSELVEAQQMITALQQQLAQQELIARNAELARDTTVLSNLKQTSESNASAMGTDVSVPPPSSTVESSDESEALRQKLRILERQLEQAGINAAEVIPYPIAKNRVTEISKRMAEISAQLNNTTATSRADVLVALKREYYTLEQDMERYHTAMMMSDEYIDQQAREAKEWEEQQHAANTAALRLVQSSMPVDIACMSEENIRSMVTPTGHFISDELARRFRRINVLLLLRVAPNTIQRMHPSVIESYRTTGLSILEKRALHEAMSSVASVWENQKQDEDYKKKAMWFDKLKDGLVTALRKYEEHDRMFSHPPISSSFLPRCPLIGKSCPFRWEAEITKLYGDGFGFPANVFAQQEIVKSNAEETGEMALQEAKVNQARLEIVRQQQQELRSHYGAMQVGEVTLAMGVLEEIEVILERIYALDHTYFDIREHHQNDQDETVEARAERGRVWELLVLEARDLVQLLARRAGICLTGKRDRDKDGDDTRSKVEGRIALHAINFLFSLVDDLHLVSKELDPFLRARSNGILVRLTEVMQEVEEKNTDLLKGDTDFCPVENRVLWQDRSHDEAPSISNALAKDGFESTANLTSPSIKPIAAPRPVALSQGYLLLEAIRAKRANKSQRNSVIDEAVGENEAIESEDSKFVDVCVVGQTLAPSA